jgi:hypothetical protein
MIDLGASVRTTRYLGRIPPGTQATVVSKVVSGSIYPYGLSIPGRPKLVYCTISDIVLESEWKPEERRQCPICERWDRAKSFSTQFDRCSSCLEDMETEDMEEWIRADYNSSRVI